ncbi:MAG: primosomal protein N' [Clostridiales bacterium]|jgi:primosomal protein N' (replication factor Y)|nr:primosomal protein N' [Clostridiales bacterium]
MPESPAFAQVIVDIASNNTDRVYTYSIPAHFKLLPGTRVLVPFGHQKVEGLVLDTSSQTTLEPGKIKAIIEPLDVYPAVLPHLVDLAKEIAQKSHCPLALALRLMFPTQMRQGRVKEKTQTVARLLLDEAALEEAIKQNHRAPKRKLLLNLLSDRLSHPVAELKALVRDPLPSLKILEEAGAVSLTEEEVYRSPYAPVAHKDPDPMLTPQQQEVLQEIVPAVRVGKGKFLLHGVTGSGKTEVYIQSARECLALRRGVIVLIPEIVLTPQMVSWFRGRFGDVAAVLHSRLSAGERYDEWRRIRSGAARLVIGARSAVFAPVRDLGLIVVDEEHEASYLSENNPRYDAREVAQSRAEREKACLILASATPSVLSFAQAQRGDYMLLEMHKRVNDRQLATVHLVDMREELRLGNRGMFSQLLIEKLGECLKAGQQAMLFINRRGYAPSVFCRKCGEVMACRQCDVKLTYHQADRMLHCHYCGQFTPLPEACPACGSSYLKPVGAGTQKVEEEFRKLFPGVQTIRMDADTTTGKDSHEQLLNQFRSGAARVMIGTQMIAKGLDFPQVTLVGVVLADLSLNMPDYRAQERTFQLLTQVAGRAGRADMPGEVVIQTYKPEHYAILTAAQQEYRGFFNQEFARRRQLLYPPFTMMVRLLCEAKTQEQSREVSAQLFAEVTQFLERRAKGKKRALFVREDEAPIKRIMGLYRAQVLMKLLEHKDSDEILAFLNELTQKDWPCRVSLEINPSSLA